MTKDRITERMKKMEAAFKERDALYKERDEAFQQRYKRLKQLEENLKEEKENSDRIRKDLQNKEKELQKRVDSVDLREKQLKQDQAAFKEEFQTKMEQLDEEELRLYELETQLKNEKVRQQIAHIRSESQELSKNSTIGQKGSKEGQQMNHEGFGDPDLLSKLQKENEALKIVLAKAEEKKAVYEQEITVLEEEKNNLFRKLLGEDQLNSEGIRNTGIITARHTQGEGKSGSGKELPLTGDKELPDKPSRNPDDGDYMDDLYEYYDQEDPGLYWDITDDNKICMKFQRDRYSVTIIQSTKPFFEIHYSVKENQKPLKKIQNIIEKDSTTFRYDREQNELVIQDFFDPHDAPEDVDNRIRCLVDFEIPELIQKGGKT